MSPTTRCDPLRTDDGEMDGEDAEHREKSGCVPNARVPRGQREKGNRTQSDCSAEVEPDQDRNAA